jgi:large subunit ribosomal protein L15
LSGKVEKMVVRKRRKKHRLRGNRTHGKGNTKNKRGAGVRGGRGKAGSDKHKYSKYYLSFGVKKRLKPKPRNKSINLGELNELLDKLVEKGKIVLKENVYVIDGKNFPFSKITSRGEILKPIEVKGVKLSQRAREKIMQSNGKIVEAVEEN